MTKAEFYNMVVELYLKTGQGAPGFITMKVGTELLDELVSEGKLKIITQYYSYLPNDNWICLTGVYCVEEEMAKGNHRPLDFVRKYLNTPRISPLDKKVDEFFAKNPAEKIKYDKEYEDWFNQNKDELERSFKIQKIEEDDSPYFNEKELNYLKERGWYQSNDKIKDCLDRLSEGDKTNLKHIELLTEMISLKKNPKVKDNYLDSIGQDETELEEVKSENKIRKKIRNFLSSQDKNNKVQDCI
jgi:hypothetical protein